MNRLHAMTMIQRAVLEDGITDPKDVFMKLRNVFPTSGDDALLGRGEVEQLAKQAIQQVGSIFFPVERERMRIDILEGELRADLLDALGGLDISNPNNCRDVFELHRKVGGSTGPDSIRDAIDTLAVAPTSNPDDIAALVARFEALYPKEDDE